MYQTMKTILKIIGVLIILIVIYAVIAMLAFGKTYHYEKSIVIDVPKEKVWQHVRSMKAVNEWNPFIIRILKFKNVLLNYFKYLPHRIQPVLFRKIQIISIDKIKIRII